MAKTTIRVRDLVEKVNRMLSLSTCGAEGREALVSVISSVLHETGNYAGFRYLDEGEVPQGHLPGIVRKPSPCGDDTVSFPDDTRVEFYLSKHLAAEKK
jgi:hypothetical protein